MGKIEGKIEGLKRKPAAKRYKAPLIISSTHSGFNKVEISPNLSVSLQAIFLKILRMILPDLVFGKPSVN